MKPQFSIQESVHEILSRTALEDCQFEIDYVTFEQDRRSAGTAMVKIAFFISDEIGRVAGHAEFDLSEWVTGKTTLAPGEKHNNDLINEHSLNLFKSRLHLIEEAVDSTRAVYVKTTPGRVLFELFKKISLPEHIVSFEVVRMPASVLNYSYRWQLNNKTIRSFMIQADRLQIDSLRSMLRSFIIETIRNASRKFKPSQTVFDVIIEAEDLRIINIPDPTIQIQLDTEIRSSLVFDESRWVGDIVNSLVSQAEEAKTIAFNNYVGELCDKYLARLELLGVLN